MVIPDVVQTVVILGSIVAAAWRIDDRFVRRRDFVSLRREVRAIRIALGIPDPEPNGGRDEHQG